MNSRCRPASPFEQLAGNPASYYLGNFLERRESSKYGNSASVYPFRVKAFEVFIRVASSDFDDSFYLRPPYQVSSRRTRFSLSLRIFNGGTRKQCGTRNKEECCIGAKDTSIRITASIRSSDINTRDTRVHSAAHQRTMDRRITLDRQTAAPRPMDLNSYSRPRARVPSGSPVISERPVVNRKSP